jgi:hypothetical protein
VSAQSTLEERYGAPSRGRRRLLVLLSAVLAVAFVGWLAWVIHDQTSPEVSSELETFSIDDAHTVTAVLVVHLASDDVKASCLLRAYAEDHTTVGDHSFTPDPSAGRRQVVTFRTERQATSVEKVGCTAPGQDRPR